MYITEIKEYNPRKIQIITNNGIAFVLYKGDLSKYNIKEGEFNEEIFNEIYTEVLPKRALARSLNLISSKDYTEFMLKDKLKGDGYPEDIIDGIIDKLKSERFINDERYVRAFIESKSFKKSKKDIIIALSLKGISSEMSERVYDELKDDGDLCEEESLIRKLLDKRHFDYENADYESRQKEIQYLLRKGFSYDSIHSAMRHE